MEALVAKLKLGIIVGSNRKESINRKLALALVKLGADTFEESKGLALSPVTLDTAVELLSLPDRVRGYGPVKEKSAREAKLRHAQLTADLVSPPPAPRQIAAE